MRTIRNTFTIVAACAAGATGAACGGSPESGKSAHEACAADTLQP